MTHLKTLFVALLKLLGFTIKIALVVLCAIDENEKSKPTYSRSHAAQLHEDGLIGDSEFADYH